MGQFRDYGDFGNQTRKRQRQLVDLEGDVEPDSEVKQQDRSLYRPVVNKIQAGEKPAVSPGEGGREPYWGEGNDKFTGDQHYPRPVNAGGANATSRTSAAALPRPQVVPTAGASQIAPQSSSMPIVPVPTRQKPPDFGSKKNLTPADVQQIRTYVMDDLKRDPGFMKLPVENRQRVFDRALSNYWSPEAQKSYHEKAESSGSETLDAGDYQKLRVRAEELFKTHPGNQSINGQQRMGEQSKMRANTSRMGHRKRVRESSGEWI